MNYIDEDKIINVIENCLNQGNDKFVIYPYGTHGKEVKRVLNTYFGLTELAIADDHLSKNDRNILCLNDLRKLGGDYIILLSSDNQRIWQEIRDELYAKIDMGRVIVDIADEKVPKEGLSFNLIGRKQHIDACDKDQVQKIFERTQSEWKRFGEKEPYWSVVTHDEFKTENIDQKGLKKFYMQGLPQTARIVSTVVRNDMVKDIEALKNLEILEIGCGCGRVTKHLAGYFRKVVAADISCGNLGIARQSISNSNVEFHLVTGMNDYDRMPQSDVVYSYLVLQHNCPPVIEYMIESMMRCVKKQGIVIFQVPTYRRNYGFDYESYMKAAHDPQAMEMHVLTQRRIFELAYAHGCIPLEVYPDYSTGQADSSTWFVLKKVEER